MGASNRHRRAAWALLASATAFGCSDSSRPIAAPGGGGAASGGGDVGTGGGDAGSGGAAGGSGGSGGSTESLRALLFSKTAGYRHASIPDAVNALQAVGITRQWEVAATEDATLFNDATLAGFNVVVWLLTSGDVLDDTQQLAFETFIQNGGGFVGVHSAADTEYDWPWYGELVGAYFNGHPAVQQATVRVERAGHRSTRMLEALWPREDEWYSFDLNPRANVMVLASLDESTYAVAGFAMGDHPICWYHGHDGGRAFYEAGGHTSASWSDGAFVEHVAEGIEWARGSADVASVLSELDGVEPNGEWSIHGPGSFAYQVAPDGLTMVDETGLNQHIVRRGVSVDPTRPYAIEVLFTIPAPLGALPNSFALNFNVDGPDDDLTPVSAWAINVDLRTPAGSVMKHMGFVDGVFNSLGDTITVWGDPGVEYLLRVSVDQNNVVAAVFQDGVLLENFSVDYAAFPYQPGSDPVRIGANTHGTDWTMRGMHVYYTD